MSNLKITAIGAGLIAMALAFTSCEGQGNEPEQVVRKTVTIVEEGFDDVHYFSFEQGKEVTVKDESKEMGWDIAFNYYYPRTNGGVTGAGEAGVYLTDKMSMGEVTSLPAADAFVKDTKRKVMASLAMPPKYTEANGNEELGKWASFSRQGGWKYDNHVFVIRTAGGKYAKVIMKSFVNEQGKSGTITMEYEYPFVGR